MSTRMHHTCCSAATHKDSRSMQRDLWNVRSSNECRVKNRWSSVDCTSSRNATPPMLTFSWTLPLWGLDDVGTPMSQVTLARTLVSLRETATVPQSAPKVNSTSRHSLKRRPSNRWFCFTADWMNCRSIFDFPGSNILVFINILFFWGSSFCFGFRLPAFKNVQTTGAALPLGSNSWQLWNSFNYQIRLKYFTIWRKPGMLKVDCNGKNCLYGTGLYYFLFKICSGLQLVNEYIMKKN